MNRQAPTPTPVLDRRQFGLCCLTVLVALLPHGSWLPPPFLLLLVALIILRWLQRARWPRPWPWLVRNGLMVVLFAAAWLSIGNFSGSQGAGFLAAMLVSKLYEAERVRDARSVATFASFLVMAQFLVQSQLWAMLAGLPGVLLALATLASLQQPQRAAPIRLLPPLRQAAGLMAVALPLALVAFALFPRLASPLWGNANATRSGGMGLSDRMEPGQIGALWNDDRIAMRVRFPDGVPANGLRYFRGLTLWSTDGSAWARPSWADTRMIDTAPVPDVGIRHEITLEADAAPWLPALDRPVAAPDGLGMAIDHSLPMPRRNRELRYQVLSNPDLLLDPFGLDPQTRALGLALPSGRNPRTLALARQLRERHPDVETFANRLLDLFRDEFAYSFEPPPLGRDAVDDFLFRTRSGYCEHYASAYATLLRAGGVPARVVLGFQGGYYNRVGGYLMVRRADAHAWVELWVQGRGWLRADPTSMVAPERVDRGTDALAAFGDNFGRSTLGMWMRERWDFLELRWTDWIVNYRAADQSALLQRLMAWLPRTPLDLGLVLTGVALAAVFALAWLLRGRARPAPGARPADALARWLLAFRQVLAGAGVGSTAAEPASRLAARAGARFPELADAITRLSLGYQRARYAGDAGLPGAPSRRALAGLWLRLRLARWRRWWRRDRT
jgi:transglutaminase-like putative cysteine protease